MTPVILPCAVYTFTLAAAQMGFAPVRGLTFCQGAQEGCRPFPFAKRKLQILGTVSLCIRKIFLEDSALLRGIRGARSSFRVSAQ